MERNPPTAGAGAPVSQTQPENAHDEDESDHESSSYISDIYEDISQADKNEEEEEEEQMSAGAGDAHEDERTRNSRAQDMPQNSKLRRRISLPIRM